MIPGLYLDIDTPADYPSFPPNLSDINCGDGLCAVPNFNRRPQVAYKIFCFALDDNWSSSISPRMTRDGQDDGDVTLNAVKSLGSSFAQVITKSSLNIAQDDKGWSG